MNATLSRSDVLKPVAWLVAILAAAIAFLVFAQASPWLLITMATVFIVSIVLYVGAYVFCLINDRDALRSEKYSLHKMAIEHRLIGDSQSGLFEPQETNRAEVQIGGPTKQIEHKS